MRGLGKSITVSRFFSKVAALTFANRSTTMTPRSPVAAFDSDRYDFKPYGFNCELWAPTVMPKPDRHNEIELNYVPAGTLTYLLGGRPVSIEPRRLVLFWAAVPHQILQWEMTKPYYVATLPLAWFLGCNFPEHLARPVLAGEIVADPRPSAGDELKFRQWTSDFRTSQPLRPRVAQLEIEARLLRMALTLGSRKAAASRACLAPAPNPALARADQIALYIARYYAEPLTAERIAKAVGLHPNYAMGLFRQAFGTTMVDFVVQHRLSHAQRLLISTDAPVIEIASAAGFRSLSRFNEAFKKACGCAPRDYRKNHARAG